MKRIFQLFTLKKYDGIYVFLYVVPFTNIFFEKLYINISKKIIYDFEDLVFLLKTSKENWIASYLKSKEKYYYLMKNSNYVVTCTPYLNDIAKKYNSNTMDISSSVDTEKYVIKKFLNKKQIVLGWSGSYSTGPYLKILEEVLEYVVPKFNLKLLVIGAKKKYIEKINHDLIPWNDKTEIEDLQNIDIGLYPLPEEEWVYGKSGLKAIQFMALGIPVIASSIGTNFRVIDHGINGYLATNKQEWIDYIKLLSDNESKRKIMGEKAREKVLKNFSVDANKKNYLKVFNFAYKNIR